MHPGKGRRRCALVGNLGPRARTHRDPMVGYRGMRKGPKAGPGQSCWHECERATYCLPYPNLPYAFKLILELHCSRTTQTSDAEEIGAVCLDDDYELAPESIAAIPRC